MELGSHGIFRVLHQDAINVPEKYLWDAFQSSSTRQRSAGALITHKQFPARLMTSRLWSAIEGKQSLEVWMAYNSKRCLQVPNSRS